ncbi:MAG: amino acid adenylation domain-containing protein [Methylovulum sp.]|nr:amino acid adenylation domain-containing protein [Methylovulum sp.]
MMLTELLATLDGLDISLYLEGGALKCRAPKDALTDALKNQLKVRKHELIEVLSQTEKYDATRITPVPRTAAMPLSYAQQRLWFLHRLEPDSALYNIPIALRLEGRLNGAALAQSIDEIVRRHESLRSFFVEVNGQPLQQHHPALALPIAHTDLTVLAEAERGAALAGLCREESAKPFDLSAGPLIRVRLILLQNTAGNEESVLLVVMHHIVSDGWSSQILTREFAALYQAFSAGKPSPLAEPVIQYADFAAWQRLWLDGPVLQRQTDYWQRQLGDAPRLLELPTDHPRPAVMNSRGALFQFSVPPVLSEQLHTFSRSHDVTLFVAMLAAFNVLLHRYSYQQAICVGTPVANRNRLETEGLIGFFVNTLVLRSDLSGDPAFSALLAQVRRTVLDAQQHQDLPFEQVVELLQPERSRSYNPLFQVWFTLQNTAKQTLDLPGLTVSLAGDDAAVAKFDLALHLQEDGQGRLTGGFEYRTDLFEAATIARLAGHYLTLLQAIVSQPDTRLSQLPLLTAAETRRLVYDWNDTAAEYPKNWYIHQLFEEQAEKTPAAVAAVFEGQTITYAGLNAKANQLAHYLRAKGVVPGVLVGLCVGRSLDMLVGLLGILKAGGAYVPIDPHYPADRIAYLLEDTQAPLLLTQQGLTAQLPRGTAEVVCLDGGWPEMARYDAGNPEPVNHPLDTAYIIYTSGSTGKPKGVMVSHRNAVHSTTARFDAYQEPVQAYLLLSSFAFDSSVAGIFWTLAQGGCLCLASEDAAKDPAALARLIERQQISHLLALPSLYGLLLCQSPAQLRSLKTAIVAGEACPVDVVTQHYAMLPEVGLFNEYGPTEGTVWSSVYQTYNADITPPLPIGRPIANVRLYLLDETLNPVPVGVYGEIYIAGEGITSGYLHRADLTAEKFIPDPFGAAGGRLYKTGDLARYQADGAILFAGRIDHQVKIRGFRIELGEIEEQLLACPGIGEAVVIVREDNPGDKRLVAYLLAQNGIELAAGELRSRLSAVLPEYMVPAAFVMLPAFPLTPNGKLDRKALPAPDMAAVVSGEYEAPQGNVETVLVKLWQELLGLEQIGRHDHFFELGGHSLLAVQLVSRLRDELGVEVDLMEFFEEPTLSGFADIVANAVQTELAVIPPADRSQPLPLSWAQQRLWFLDKLDSAAGKAYHIPVGLRLRGQLDKTALQATLDRIVARHEDLRTRFVSIDGQPVQVIAPADSGFSLQIQDLTGLAGDAQAAEAARITGDETGHPFDLAAGPLIRGRLLQLADDEHVLLITQHHIISDGWSIGLLVKEFSALYSAFSQNRPDPLPPLAIQYADYAAWQRQWLQGDVLQVHIGYWQDHLKSAPALLELPTDRLRPPLQSYRGGSIAIALSAGLSAALQHTAQRHGVTLFMVLLGGWSALMARLSGQTDVVIGTPVANRQRAEIEGLIGFFVNTLALRVDLQGDPSVAQLLAQVKATTLNAYAHQDIPFEQVVEAVNPPRSMGHSPVFQAMLSLNNTPGGSALELPGLSLEPIELPYTTTQFDLSLSLTDVGGEIVGSLEYASDLFDAATAERIAAYYQTLLAGIVANDRQPVSQLPLLDAGQRRQILARWGSAHAEYPQPLCLHQLFERQVEKTPDAVAVTFENNNLSYAELNRKANQVAHYLLALGIRPDDRVAICLERGVEMVVGLLGILKAGGAYIPLDPSYPADRLGYMLSDSAPVALLSQSAVQIGLPDLAALKLPTLLLDKDAPLAHYPGHNPDTAALGLTPQHLAYIIYTSGSTGLPKGVMVEHAQVARLFAATQAQFHFDNTDVWTLFHSFAFDFSVWELWGALLYGGRLVLVPYLTSRSPDAFYALLCKERVTVLNQTPSAFRQLINAQAQNPQPHALRCIIFGGEALEFHTLAPWIERNDPEQVQLINMYGITEITVHATYRRILRADIDAQRGSVIGRPLADLSCHILDAQRQPVPPGVTGEIYIGGAGVARGYLNRPELTEERFISDPFTAGTANRLYKTGDLGRWLADGQIEYLGRNDFQVKLRGFRIELGEIEARLIACAGVRDAVVIVREDSPGDKRLVAYLIAEHGAELSTAALRAQLASTLADYMIPSAFVSLAAFPLNANGKLDRRALPAPDGSAVPGRHYEAPQGAAETTLAAIWQDLLGLGQVGRHDNFFELGGHSLMVVTLIERLRQQGWTASVQAVFITPTLSAMAAAIATGGNNPAFKAPPNLIPEACTQITPEMLTLVSLSQQEIDGICADVPGGAANIQDIYPLAPLQEGILFHHLLQTQGDTYLSRTVITFDDRNRLDTFLAALQTVINRHDILRTAIHWQGLPQPVQVVQRAAPLPVGQLDLDLEGDALEQLLAVTDPLHTRLDLQQAPLFAATTACDPHTQKWLLALLRHHLAIDHVTLELIISEIRMLLEGQGNRLPTALPYRQFIAQTLAVPMAGHEAYFREQLGDIDEPTAPFGLTNIRSDDKQVNKVSLALTDALAVRVADTARQLGVSAAVLFHVAWAQVLAQCCGRDDVVFGTVLVGRLQGSAGADRVLGMFINTLPVRISLRDMDVQQAVHAAYRRLSELLSHEQASLALAQRCSGVSASTPLFTTLLNYRHSKMDNVDDQFVWDGVTIMEGEEWDNYPISVYVDDLGAGFSITAQCVHELDAGRIAAYLYTAIVGLVDALAQDPQRKISALSILPANERQQVLNSFNATTADYPSELLIQQLIEQQVAQTPNSIAVVYAQQSLSYDALNRQANRIAHYLLGLNLRPDDRVGVFMERSLELVAALLGILKAGGAYVPLDPSYPTERIAVMLADSAPVAILTQAALQERLPQLAAEAPVLALDSAQALFTLTMQADTNPDPKALGLTSQNLAYIIYTSGSTGQPKGVMNQHDGVVNRLCWAQHEYRLGGDDRVLQKTPFSFDVSVWEFFLPLLAGARLVMARPEGHQDPHYLAGLIVSAGVTMVHFVPSMLQVFLEQAELGRHRLRRVLCSGEALPYALQSKFLTRWPEIELHNLYGPTEAAIDVTSWRCNADQHPGIVPIGRPIANMQLYILDPHLQPVPQGIVGELYIGGIGVARGYLNQPELTAGRFIPDPFREGRGSLYKTGDLGRWLPDGSIEFLGRNDFQVKLRGFRIELGEIEARLASCDGVSAATVIAREEAGGDKRLVAYVIPQDGVECPIAGLRAQLAVTLADYMIPGAFVILPEFPLTANGKLDRRALPAPDGASVLSRQYEAPQGATETALAGIWQELLGLERIGRHDNFFELGGHSLTAVQFSSRLRQELGVEIALRELFNQPTLAGFAQLLVDAQACEQQPILSAGRSQPLPLSWAQQRLWFLDQFDPAAGRAYHLPTGLRLHGKLDCNALQAALDRIIARHEILRTRFVSINGQPVQVIADAGCGFALYERDLRTMLANERADAIARICADETNQPFDLSAGPLIRGLLLCLNEDDHILLVTQHHIISDGWSIGLLIREFSTLYTAFSQNLPDPLPDLAIQYADYALWQRQWLQGKVLQMQTEFWQKHLAGAPALLELPTDRPRPAQQSYRGGSIELSLPAGLAAKLRDTAQHHGVTLFMVLLSGWSALMSRLSGQDDIVTGTPVANRQRAELESLIGFFVNTLALRVDLQGDPTVAQLLAQVKAMALDAYAHQDIPFEQVVEAVNPPRSMGHSPIFQTMLALDNTPDSGAAALPGLDLAPIELPYTTTQFDLSLSLTDVGNGIIGNLEYAGDLFDAATAERIAGYFKTLLAGMTADDRQAISRLPLLGREEQYRLLTGFNATAADYAGERLVHKLFEAQVEKTPDALAAVFEDSTLTYAQLNAKANQLAHYLVTQGIGPDMPVGIGLERSLDMAVAVLAILKAGGAYLPLDPDYPAERLAYMLEDSQAALLLTHSGLLAALPSGNARRVDLNACRSIINALPETNPRSAVHPDNLAYIIYTSGSTDRPKAVMVSHGSLANAYCAWRDAYRLGDTARAHLQMASLSFDVCAGDFVRALLSGDKLVICPRALLLEAPKLYALMRREHIRVAEFVPAVLRNLIRYLEQTQQNLDFMDLLICGSDTWSKDEYDHFGRFIGGHTRLINSYGLTEATIDSLYYEAHGDATAGVLAIGRPFANTRAYLLDRHCQPVPIGVAGELYLAGVGLARGYRNHPELTAEKFIPDPFSEQPGGRLYKTGDLARHLPTGDIEFLGRADAQVKIRGFRVEPAEIEARLAACDGVRDAIVIAREDRPGDKRLVAYLIAQAGFELSPAHIRAQLTDVLADYMVPSAFVMLPGFPLTPNGKLDRRALPAPDSSAVVNRCYEAPQGATETALATIWQELLGLERIGRHDNFFELGGHSLLAVQLLSRIAQAFGIDVPLRTLFVQPVLSGFAAALSAQAPAVAYTNLVPIRPEGRQRPLFLIHPRGGQVDYARTLAPWLDADLPVYGLHATGFMAGETPLVTIAAMAARYLEEIRTVQPEGPYRIAGYSSGGVIAYEIAGQLLGIDECVEFVGLIDSYLEDETDRSPEDFDECAFLFSELLKAENLPAPEILQTLKTQAACGDFDAMLAYCQAAGLIPQGIDKTLVRRHLAVFHATDRALKTYSPAPVSAPLTLFTATEGLVSGGASHGWGAVANGFLHIVPVGGTHLGIVEQPHIRQLGEAISDALAQATEQVWTHPEHEHTYRMMIQSGNPGVPPLFCIPGAGASITTFYGLSQALDPGLPVYGLQPRGLDGVLVPHHDVPAAARAYIQAIREIVPNGPYHLLGHSFGAWVVFEMALQLTAAGEQIGTLLILDAKAPPTANQRPQPPSRVDILMKLAGLYELNTGQSLGLTAADFAGRDNDSQLKLLMARLIDVKLMSPKTGIRALAGIVRVFETNMNTHYAPTGRYLGAAHLIGAEETDSLDDMLALWRRHAPETVLWQASGNHISLLFAPHVDTLAVRLQGVIDGGRGA